MLFSALGVSEHHHAVACSRHLVIVLLGQLAVFSVVGEKFFPSVLNRRFVPMSR